MKAEQDGQGFGWLEVLGKIYQELPLGPVDGDGSGQRILRINGPGSAKNDYEEDFQSGKESGGHLLERGYEFSTIHQLLIGGVRHQGAKRLSDGSRE